MKKQLAAGDVLGFVRMVAEQIYLVKRLSHTEQYVAVGEAIDFAIRHGFRFAVGDYAALVERYRKWRCSTAVVLASNHVDQHHTLACRAENDSAAKSIDAFAGQPAVFGMSPGVHNRLKRIQGGSPGRRRLHLGSEFYVGTEVWTVTKMPHEAGKSDDGEWQIKAAIKERYVRDPKVLKRAMFLVKDLCPKTIAEDRVENGQDEVA